MHGLAPMGGWDEFRLPRVATCAAGVGFCLEVALGLGSSGIKHHVITPLVLHQSPLYFVNKVMGPFYEF